MNELYDQWASDNNTWKQPWAIGGPWQSDNSSMWKVPKNSVFEAMTLEQMEEYEKAIRHMRVRAERKRLSDQLVDTDLPLDDLLDNIDEVREFLKHIKSIKQ